ncbi:MAG TPA: class I SAM-dependent methyltransferase [Thermoleophilia bacterium]|nr:class I SAM-dependent methyltransferase [Thermoleophilia bacterium]
MGVFKVLAASVRDFGLVDTLDRLPLWALSPLTRSRLRRRKLAQSSQDGFDEAHGTDTAGILVGREQGLGVSDGGHVVSHYETSSETAIRLALDSLPIDPSGFTFVDLGCGKGKPLMVAASYGFRRLVGVDISPVCIQAARRNIERYGPEPIDASRVELRVEDAEDFEFPDDPLVVYLFNPFPQSVVESVIAKLEESLSRTPREVTIVYMNPTAAAAVRRSAFFRRIPTIADRMPSAADGLPRYQRAAVFVHAPG